MKSVTKTSVATAIGAVVLSSLSAASFAESANPFGAQQLESGYMQFAAEGKCGADDSYRSPGPFQTSLKPQNR